MIKVFDELECEDNQDWFKVPEFNGEVKNIIYSHRWVMRFKSYMHRATARINGQLVEVRYYYEPRKNFTDGEIIEVKQILMRKWELMK